MKGKTNLRDLSETELEQKGPELREEVFNLRFQVSMAMAENPARRRRPGASWRASDDPARATLGSGGDRRGGEACRRPGRAWWSATR